MVRKILPPHIGRDTHGIKEERVTELKAPEPAFQMPVGLDAKALHFKTSKMKIQ